MIYPSSQNHEPLISANDYGLKFNLNIAIDFRSNIQLCTHASKYSVQLLRTREINPD